MPTKARTTLPRIEPIVPKLRHQPFNDPAWLFEPKYDGWRGMVYLTRQSCTIYSKRQNALARFDDLRKRICATLPRRELILDGEIIAVNDEGRMDFLALIRGQGHIVYAVFDVLWSNGRDLRDLPLTERKKRLRRLLPDPTETIVPILSIEEHGFELLEAAARLDLEGIVAKRKTDPYNQRVRWWKVKNPLYTQSEGRGELFERGVGACVQLWTGIATNSGIFFETECIIARGDRGGIRWRLRWGPEHGDSVRGVNLMRVRDGQIVEALGYVKGG